MGVRWQVDLDLAWQLILASAKLVFLIIVDKGIVLALIEGQLVRSGVLLARLGVQVASIISSRRFHAGLL